jgi:hypothetical protein
MNPPMQRNVDAQLERKQDHQHPGRRARVIITNAPPAMMAMCRATMRG